MHRLGHTRSSHKEDHLLQTPDTFVRAPLPGMRNATAIVHIGPARGAGFTQYTAEFEANGALGSASAQRFVYVLEGELKAAGKKLKAGGYAYLPANEPVTAARKSRAAVIEKPYESVDGHMPPGVVTGDQAEVPGVPMAGGPGVTIQSLIPADAAFDLAVNIMTFVPGAALPLVEIPVLEHGLLMLDGGGIFRMGDCWYASTAGDFVWFAPFCPQWFGAIGQKPARYLIYKDWNRHPL